MDRLELFEKLIKLEKKYRLQYTDKEELTDSERYYLENSIFPDWWFSSNKYELKLELLVKALDNNQSLLELPEINIIKNRRSNIRLEHNIKKFKKKDDN